MHPSPPHHLELLDASAKAYPPGWRVDTALGTSPPTLDLASATAEALARPVAGPRLAGLVRPGMRVSVVVPDQTRACPTDTVLPLLLKELASAGVPESQVTVVLALGMHRDLRKEELETLLGPAAGRLRIVQAQGKQASRYRDLGELTPEETGLSIPVPVRIHEATQDCHFLMSIGLVEPHQYAGWSGGRKTVGIGCAAAQTIGALHGPEVLDHPGTRLGILEGNPVHRALEAVARRAGLSFCLNIALDGDGRPIAVAAGQPAAVLEDLVRRASPYVHCFVEPEPYDVVLAGVDPPKAVNLYQASRALTYIAFGPQPPIREGGWIVAEAPCPEGEGEGPAEQEFRRVLESSTRPVDVLERVRQGTCAVGGQRAFMVAKALLKYRMMIVGARNPALIRACHLQSAPDLRAAFADIQEKLPGEARVLVVPNAFATIPVPRSVA